MKEIKEINDDGAVLLGNAIIEQAVIDYKKAHKTLKKMQAPDCLDAMRKQKKYSKQLDGLTPEEQQEYLEMMRDRIVIGAERTIKEVENFFHSQLYSAITTIDGDVILERLKKEIQNDV